MTIFVYGTNGKIMADLFRFGVILLLASLWVNPGLAESPSPRPEPEFRSSSDQLIRDKAEPLDADKLARANALLAVIPPSVIVAHYQTHLQHPDGYPPNGEAETVSKAITQYDQLWDLLEIGRSVFEYHGLLGKGSSTKYRDDRFGVPGHPTYELGLGVRGGQYPNHGPSMHQYHVYFDDHGIIFSIKKNFQDPLANI
jgi:hypothetical protein